MELARFHQQEDDKGEKQLHTHVEFISEQYSTAVLESIASGYSDERIASSQSKSSTSLLHVITAFMWRHFYNKLVPFQ